MAIVGLTVNEAGEVLQRLAVTTKVAIGEKVKAQNGKTHPGKLDHFIFLRKTDSLDWELDPELMQFYGEECREIWVILRSDVIENVFRTELAWWSATEKRCWGEGGGTGTRKTKEHPEGEDWRPCGAGCPELDSKLCKPSGDLYFMLADFPKLGGVCRIHTSGKRSVAEVSSSIEEIRTMTGGRLAGICCKLKVRPEKTSYLDAGGTKKPTTIYVLSLELSAKDAKELPEKMVQYGMLFQSTQKLLGPGRKIEYIAEEPEAVRAAEIQPEFYPAEDIKPAPQIVQPSRVSTSIVPEVMPANANGNGHGPVVITDDQRHRFIDIAVAGGWGNQQAKDLLLEHWGFVGTAAITTDKYEEICAAFKGGKMPEKKPYQATNVDIPF
jgi:hypothetical protein